MIQKTEEHDEIESSKFLRIEVVHTHDPGNDRRSKGLRTDPETLNAFRVKVDRDNLGRSTPFSLKGEEPFGTANVEDPETRHSLREPEIQKLFPGRI